MSDRSQEKKQEGETSRGQKPRGWHSRKHSTSQKHEEARAAYMSEHGPQARYRKADEREELRAKRTPEEQLAILDQRLGVDQGARKERARLQALIKARS